MARHFYAQIMDSDLSRAVPRWSWKVTSRYLFLTPTACATLDRCNEWQNRVVLNRVQAVLLSADFAVGCSNSAMSLMWELVFCSWYLKALRIAPKNGSPYHQLALLALYTVGWSFRWWWRTFWHEAPLQLTGCVFVCLYVCFSVCNGAKSQRLGALLRLSVFYSVHIARRAFSTHGITNIPHHSDRSNKRPWDKNEREQRMRCRGRPWRAFVSHHE